MMNNNGHDAADGSGLAWAWHAWHPSRVDEMQWSVASSGTLGGKPCVRGTRISVAFILELMASGATCDAILQSYPQLTAYGLEAALRKASTSRPFDR
jgi:uncharacterized protein (DUF433 family)